MKDYEAANQAIDRFISKMPDVGYFGLLDIIRKNIEEEEIEFYYKIRFDIENALIEYNLAERDKSKFRIKLTPPGLEAKKIGSYSELIKKK